MLYIICSCRWTCFLLSSYIFTFLLHNVISWAFSSHFDHSLLRWAYPSKSRFAFIIIMWTSFCFVDNNNRLYDCCNANKNEIALVVTYWASNEVLQLVGFITYQQKSAKVAITHEKHGDTVTNKRECYVNVKINKAGSFVKVNKNII